MGGYIDRWIDRLIDRVLDLSLKGNCSVAAAIHITYTKHTML